MNEQDPALNPSLDPLTLDDEAWSKLLSPEEFRISRRAGTERAFTGPFLEEERAGDYHCVACAAKLYGAQHKFHSGCGWPSFFEQVEPNALTVHEDTSLSRVRTEMRCARCGGHLGHIFKDAPKQPTGMRHCVNGEVLVFVPEGESVQDAFLAHRAKGK